MPDVGVGTVAIDVKPQGESVPIGEPPVDPHLLDDQIPGDRVIIQGQPRVEAAEESRSAQSFDTLAEYTVPQGQAAFLVEVSANIDSNGEVRFAVPYSDPVSFTGSVDVTFPFEQAVLGPGDTVSLTHQSTDGTSATNRGFILAKEV